MVDDQHGNGADQNSEPGDHAGAISTKRRPFMAALGAFAGTTTLASSTRAEQNRRQERDVGEGRAHNAILVIPDGAGQAMISAARYLNAYQEDPDEFPHNVHPDGATLNVDRAEQVGQMSTYPDDPDLFVTDSAAAGTAMATGTKTFNGAVSGVGSPGEFSPVETLLEKAYEAGMATGLVTTTRITHATPAVFASHVPDRGLEDEIARQYVEDGIVDVLMGGGREHFDPEERDDGEDLLAAAEEQGYQLAETADDLESVGGDRVLGLFGADQERTSHMSYYLDRLHEPDNTEPTLDAMTAKAVEILSSCRHGRRNGFFLMVEAGRVDHQGHVHDPGIAAEQLEGDLAFGVALDYAEDPSTRPTLAVQVGDHETGGFSLGSNAYDVNWEAIAAQRASFERLQELLDDVDGFGTRYDEIAEIFSEWAGFEPTRGELMEINANDESLVVDALNGRGQLGWSSDSHTGEEVPAYAFGPGAEHFGRYFDNTEVAAGFAAALDIESPNGATLADDAGR